MTKSEAVEWIASRLTPQIIEQWVPRIHVEPWAEDPEGHVQLRIEPAPGAGSDFSRQALNRLERSWRRVAHEECGVCDRTVQIDPEFMAFRPAGVWVILPQEKANVFALAALWILLERGSYSLPRAGFLDVAGVLA